MVESPIARDKLNGRHLIVRSSSTGVHFCETTSTFVHQELFMRKQTPPPFVLPVLSLPRSRRYTEKPTGCMALSEMFGPSQVSVKQYALHSRRSLLELMRLWSSSSLFPMDCRFANSMVGMGGRVERRLHLTRLVFPFSARSSRSPVS